MLPLIPFIAGIVAGSAAIRIYRNKKTQDSLKGAADTLKKKSGQAQEALRHAAVSGLSSIESSSARLRDRLQAVDEEAPVDEKKTTSVKKSSTSGTTTRKRAAPKTTAAPRKTRS